MPSPAREYVYDRAKLAEVLGVEINTVNQHIRRGYVEPHDLISVVKYLAHFAPEKLRIEIATEAIRRPGSHETGGRKRGKKEST
jgi:hypothetical protein